MLIKINLSEPRGSEIWLEEPLHIFSSFPPLASPHKMKKFSLDENEPTRIERGKRGIRLTLEGRKRSRKETGTKMKTRIRTKRTGFQIVMKPLFKKHTAKSQSAMTSPG